MLLALPRRRRLRRLALLLLLPLLQQVHLHTPVTSGHLWSPLLISSDHE